MLQLKNTKSISLTWHLDVSFAIISLVGPCASAKRWHTKNNLQSYVYRFDSRAGHISTNQLLDSVIISHI